MTTDEEPTMNVDATQWTMTLGKYQQVIERKHYVPGVNPGTEVEHDVYMVVRQAKEWTKWPNHLNHNPAIGDKKTPRRVAKSFDTLEEATRFAAELLRAEYNIKQAYDALDELTAGMRLG